MGGQSCSCVAGCSKCSVHFALDVLNDSEDVMHVTSRDLILLEAEDDYHQQQQQPHHGGGDDDDNDMMMTSGVGEDGHLNRVLPIDQVFPSEDPVLIVKLAPRQSIKLTCRAVKGIGKAHAKWIPVSVATYQFDPRVEIAQDLFTQLEEEKREAFVASCPTHVYSLEPEGRIAVSRRQNCMFCQECVQKAEEFGFHPPEQLVRITPIKDRFVFSVESTGALRPEKIVTEALQVLLTKLEDLEKEMRTWTDDL